MSNATVELQDPQVAQREAALAKGNEVRFERARLRKAVKTGDIRFRDLILDPPDCVAKLMIAEFLCWPTRFGPTRAVRTLRLASVSGTRPVGKLTDREKLSLSEQLRLVGVA